MRRSIRDRQPYVSSISWRNWNTLYTHSQWRGEWNSRLLPEADGTASRRSKARRSWASAVRHAGNSRHTRQPALRRCESSGCPALRQSFRYGYTHSVVPLLALGSRASFFVHNASILKIWVYIYKKSPQPEVTPDCERIQTKMSRLPFGISGRRIPIFTINPWWS